MVVYIHLVALKHKTAMSKTNANDDDQFDWVQFKKDYAVSNVESKKEKLMRKITENPLVPIGMAFFY